MGVLFISHSSRDNDAAIKVRVWLKSNGWGEVFLDLDPEHGLAPGHRWQQELKQAGERCSGVVVLISPDWLASRWCQTEFLLADQLGKRIFPILIRPAPFDDLPIELRAKFQIVDISDPANEAEGFERLAIGLKRAGLDPKSFEWPPPGDPHRSIYRGLQSLDVDDAAIYFGRDAQITKGLDALRRMRGGAPERVLAILGASGAGKSSFLKAGLIARLKRDEENFLVMPVIRPERAALTGEHGLAASLSTNAGALLGREDVRKHSRTSSRATIMERFRRFAESARETFAGRSVTIVIPIDQAEELFATENSEASRVLEMLAPAVAGDGNAIVVATIRSDSFEKMQNAPQLAGLEIFPFSLAPIPHGAFKDVIECPARLANPAISIEPALTDQLLADLAEDDALPLLAFTLEQLLWRCGRSKTLTHDHYMRELGGLAGAIAAAVESAFAAAARDPVLPNDRLALEKLARAAFIPGLVQIDDADAEPTRRVERLDALPEATRPLVRHLVDEPLLVCDRRTIDGAATDLVEVAHEAILRQWTALKAWIAEERDALRTLDGLRASASEWRKHRELEGERERGSWLVHRGGRLEEAEALAARIDFAHALNSTVREYLAACRNAENAELIREKQALARTRRLQRNIGIIISAAGVLVLVAGLGVCAILAGLAVRTSDTLTALAAKESESGNYDSAARYALAGMTAVNWPFLRDHGNAAEAELRGAASLSSARAVLRGTSMILGASFNPDGSRVVTASQDGTACIWDLSRDRKIVTLRGHTREVLDAVFSPDAALVLTASADGTARLWDAQTGKEIRELRGHDSAVVSAAFSADGRRIVTASRDNTARVWDAATGQIIGVLRGHDDQLERAAFSPDGTRIVTASDDGTARIWETVSWKTLLVLRGHQGIVVSAAFSPDGQRVLTASADRTAQIWDAATGRPLVTLRGHELALTGAVYNPDGTRVITASYDRTARIWDSNSGSSLSVLAGHDNTINGAAFSRAGKLIVTASDDRTARVWEANIAGRMILIRGHEDAVNDAAFDERGARIVTASTDKTARIWDASSGRELAVLRGHLDLVESAAFSRDGARVVTASDDRTARIWDARRGTQNLVLRGHADRVNSAAFDMDGRRVVTASADATARIWNANTGRVLLALHGHTRGLNNARFSPDGKRVATASEDGTARIWDAVTGRSVLVVHAPEGGVVSAAFSRDGTRLVTAGRDRTARVWDASTGRQLAVLRGHDAVVLTAEFSPDGKSIITGSPDMTARLWDAATGVEIAVLRGDSRGINSAAFSPDGMRVVTASEDALARVWNLSGLSLTTRQQLIRQVCNSTLAHGLSELSAAELRSAPVLDPALDRDACQPPGALARLARTLWAGIPD